MLLIVQILIEKLLSIDYFLSFIEARYLFFIVQNVSTYDASRLWVVGKMRCASFFFMIVENVYAHAYRRLLGFVRGLLAAVGVSVVFGVHLFFSFLFFFTSYKLHFFYLFSR